MRTAWWVVLALLAAACGGPDEPRAASLTPDTAPPAAPASPSTGTSATPDVVGEGPGTPDPSDKPPAVHAAAARPPDAAGWYTSAVVVRADASDDRMLSDVCFVVVPNYPDGTGASSLREPCTNLGARRWNASRNVREEARNIVQLWAVDDAGQQTNHPVLDIRLDVTAPTSTIRSPSGPFVRHVVLEGESADASSGVAHVRLMLSRDGDERRVDAACACPSAFRTKRPPDAWRWEGDLEAGRWTVRVVATDHAGHTDGNPPSAELIVG